MQGAAGIPQAERCFQEALMLQPQSARAWRGLGDAARESGAHQKAVDLYTEARPPRAPAGAGTHVFALSSLCSAVRQ